jgi:hypothetical protein
VRQDALVLLVALHQAERAFANAQGSVEPTVEMGLGGVAFDELDLDAGLGSLGAGVGELGGGEVKTGDAVAAAGELDGVPPGAAADVEDGLGPVPIELHVDEINLADGALGEGLGVVGSGVVCEQLFVPRSHAVAPRCPWCGCAQCRFGLGGGGGIGGISAWRSGAVASLRSLSRVR